MASGPPRVRSQNKGYWQFCSNLLFPFRLLGFQVCLKPYQGQFGKPLRHRSWLETIFIQKFKTFYPNFLKHPIFPSILIKYCLYPLFWLLTPGGPIDLITALSSEFLLGTEIAHYKEENESLVTNIWGHTVLVMGYYKNSVTSEHPVFRILGA